MPRQEINLGTAPTGAGGDTTRGAAAKINAMTSELYARNAQLGSASNANIGTAPGQVMAVGTSGLSGLPSALPYMTNLYNMTGRSFEVGQYVPVNGSRAPGAVSDYGLAIGLQGANSEWRHMLQFTTDGDIYDVSITNPSQGGQWRVAKILTSLNITVPTPPASGSFVTMTGGTGAAATLPAGGTWAYSVAKISADSGVQWVGSTLSGVAAGGSAIAPATPGIAWQGFAWRFST